MGFHEIVLKTIPRIWSRLGTAALVLYLRITISPQPGIDMLRLSEPRRGLLPLL